MGLTGNSHHHAVVSFDHGSKTGNYYHHAVVFFDCVFNENSHHHAVVSFDYGSDRIFSSSRRCIF